MTYILVPKSPHVHGLGLVPDSAPAVAWSARSRDGVDVWCLNMCFLFGKF